MWKDHGPEVQTLLGHASANVTELYAEKNTAAVEVVFSDYH